MGDGSEGEWGEGRCENAEKRENLRWGKASRLQEVTDQQFALNSSRALASGQFNDNDEMGGDEGNIEINVDKGDDNNQEKVWGTTAEELCILNSPS